MLISTEPIVISNKRCNQCGASILPGRGKRICEDCISKNREIRYKLYLEQLARKRAEKVRVCPLCKVESLKKGRRYCDKCNAERAAERKRIEMRQKRKNNPEERQKSLDRIKRWKQENPERVKEIKRFSKRKQMHRRRHDQITTLTRKDWEKAKDYFGHRCAYCGGDGPLHQDHWIPFAAGGHLTPDNVVPACHSCNERKSNMNPLDWMAKCDGNFLRYLAIVDFLRGASHDIPRPLRPLSITESAASPGRAAR